MRILFTRFSSLGDIILTTGIFRHLKSAFPAASVEVLTYDTFADILHLCPSVNAVHAVPRKSSAYSIYRHVRTLGEFDAHFDLHGSIKSRAVSLGCSAPTFRYKKQSLFRRLYVQHRLFEKKLQKHVILKYAEAVLPNVGLAVPELETLRPQLDITPDIRSNGMILLHPFASKKTKEYPHLSVLAEMLMQQGERVGVIGTGSARIPAGAVDFTNRTDLKGLTALIRGAKLLISTDSGPMHIAAATNTPLVSIFGPTTAHFGFSPDFTGCAVVQVAGLSCRPCHVHGTDVCPQGHFRCMTEIQPEMVIEHLRQRRIIL